MTFYRHTLSGAVDGELWAINWYTSDGGGGSIDDAHAAAVAAASDLWDDTGSGTGWGPQCPAIVTLTSCKTASLNPTTGKQVSTRQDGLSFVGSYVGNMIPPQCAVVVSERTDLATHEGRGRVYLPATGVGSLTATGQLNSTAQANAAAAWGHALSGMLTAGYQPVIYHRASRSGTNIISVDVGQVIDTQRRRRDKLIETRVSAPVA
jgi:hypothetical protein